MKARAVLRIARWEVLKGTGTLDRRTVLGFVAAVAVTAALGAALSGATVTHDAGLYRVGVAPDSPYHGPAAADPAFAVREPDRAALERGDLDLLVADGEVVAADTRKGRAALADFRRTVGEYNDRQMRAEVAADEDRRSAAFPVAVRLEYARRGTGTGGTADGGGGGGDGGSGDGDAGAGDGGSGDGTGGLDAGGGTDEELSVPRVGGQPILSSGQSDTPSGIEPPFPLGALVLAFLFVVPMNFVAQAYGASILRERMNRRGELLLVAPVSPGSIVAGKTLPYFLALLAVSAVTAVGVGGGVLAVAGAVPIALVFLAATFVAAMFARSFKELTFLTVTISVVVTSYAFVPAIFTEVTPIALISPLTVVVRDLLGQGVTAGEYAFSTGPFYLSSAVLFALGAGIYREEDLFTQRPVHLKALDALASRLRGRGSVLLLTVALVPFVVVAELLAVALLFALPAALALPVLLTAIALIEELAKSAHVYAAYHHDLFDPGVGFAASVGAASGVGFFLAEKATAVVQLVGLPQLSVGRAAFADSVGLLPLGLLVFAPLVLHAGTAAVTGIGASRGTRAYLASYAVAVGVHLAYNAGVLALVV